MDFFKWIVVLGLLVGLLSACGRDGERELILGETSPGVGEVTSVKAAGAMSLPAKHTVHQARLSVVGDIMVHRTQLIKAYHEDGFDFAPSFQWIAPYIKEADYAIGNLETTLAGPDGQRRINVEKFYQHFSGYPVFNSPDILAKNLKDAGFDLMITANNHSLDSKESGLLRTIKVLEDEGFDQIGTYATPAESDAFFIKEINGIKFGIVNYTYAMNGFELDEADDYMIHHLDNYNDLAIEAMYDRVEQLSKEDLDFVVATLHYGIEYRNEPDERIQQPLVEGLFDHGADIILGGHPHVLQPFEVRELVRKDGQVETGVVIYSLGNFISSQRHRYTNKDTDFGMVFGVDFKKVDDEKATIEAIHYTPTYVHWSASDLEIVPLYKIPEGVTLTLEDQGRIDYGINHVVPLINSYYKGDYTLEEGTLRFDLGK